MLVKQGIDISFAQGLDTKTDKKRVQMGKFLQLQNTVFNKGGLLQKRNGYAQLTSLPNATYSYLTTFNNNLTALGTNIAAYSTANASWISRGTIQPLSLSTLPLLRNNLNQIDCDSVVAPNGLVCTVFRETNGVTTTNKYVIADSVTGQNIVAPTVIPVSSGTVSGGMRVFYLGTHFILVFTNTITATDHLQYVAVNAYNTTVVGTNTDIASIYASAVKMSWDGYVFNNNLYIAYNTATGGQQIKATYLSANLAPVLTAVSFAGQKASIMSLTADVSTSYIYINWVNSATDSAYSVTIDRFLATIAGPTHITDSPTAINNITAAAQNGVGEIYLDCADAYTYDSAIPTNFITSFSITGTSVGAQANIARSVGLASKAFIYNSTIYFMAVYKSPYQPTYFLINASTSLSTAPVIAAKLAYENGSGYLTVGLPSVTLTGATAQIAYLFKDLIQAVNKNTNTPAGTQTGGIYSQTGINLGSFVFGTNSLDTAEIGSNLHISGGFLGMYDGYLPVEHNFFVWPDSVEATWTAAPVTPTGTALISSTSITLSSASGVAVGMVISDTSNPTYIPAGTTITALSGVTATISNATTHAFAGDNLSISGSIAAKPDGSTNTKAYWYQVTYEWTDNQGNAFRSAPSVPIFVTTTGSGSTGSITVNVPTLRLTMKTANPVKIVIYRWSVAQQNYYQVTSITSPVLNNTDVNQVAFVDVSADASILGNNLIYTSGGVVEDINAPANDLMTLFDTRLWVVDAEDPNLLRYSKQVIEATPVEMSDLLTLFVPPNTGTTTSTGPITSITVMDDKLILGKKNAFVYINGTGPDNTGANNQYSQPIFITSTVGCANQKSIVLMPKGLMFQSDKGIWLLDRGLGTSYIGAPVEDFTTGAIVNSAVIVPETNQVRFTLDTGITLMYDYYYDQWGTFVNVPAVSSCVFQDMHTFINSHGAVYQESEGAYLDGSSPVLIMFQTGPLRLGDLQGYQRAYFFYLLGDYISPHKLVVNLFYDYSTSSSQSIIISPINFSSVYGSGASQDPYGQGNPYGGPGNAEEWRVFLAQQRCKAVGIQVQEIFDASFGVASGAGLTLSGINMVCAFKKGYVPVPAAISAG